MESLLGSASTLIIFLLMLGLLVLVHELGHFLTARRLGIMVEEFGIGFPPRAVTLFEHDGVKYTLNWLPIGGFVRFGGEGETVYGVGSLAAAAPWKKIAVLAAGPLMNLVLAIAIFSAVFAVNGVPTPAGGIVLGDVFQGSPAERAGLKSGDIVLRLDGQLLGMEDQQVMRIAESNSGKPIIAEVERDGQPLNIEVTPGSWTTAQGEQRKVGFGFAYGDNVVNQPVSLPEALVQGFNYTWLVLGQFISGLGQMIGSLFGVAEAPPGGVTGIVGIARGTGEVIERNGWEGFWRWTALISLNLFLINLLPIPALDGSHIMFALLEIVRRGKKIPPEKEALVHAVGFVMLMGLMVIVTVSDISHWIGGGSVLGN
ncbi:MAG TPA: M50 family metallopeptidase [Roseiflexaceae bacterium]|nr:M50 family metallopeptidase [Roseiflexaceae bacterium]